MCACMMLQVTRLLLTGRDALHQSMEKVLQTRAATFVIISLKSHVS